MIHECHKKQNNNTNIPAGWRGTLASIAFIYFDLTNSQTNEALLLFPVYSIHILFNRVI
jgi:hypothetical protein